MVNKKLINGLKYEKLSEEQLYDLSSWELVDIILAYRKDYKAKEQECERLKNFHINLVGVKECEIKELLKLKKTLAEIKEIAEDAKTKVFVDMEEFWKQILQKISECEVGSA